MTVHDNKRHVTYRLPFGYTLTRVRAERPPHALRATALFLIGLALIAVHDIAYRQTVGADGDFELWGTISHAGLDMLAITIMLTVAAYILDRRDQR